MCKRQRHTMPLSARAWRLDVPKTELNRRRKNTFFHVPPYPRQPPSSNGLATKPDRTHASGLPYSMQLAGRRFEQPPPNALSCSQWTATLQCEWRAQKTRYSQHWFDRYLGERFPGPSAVAYQTLVQHTLYKGCANGRGIPCLCRPGHGG